MRRQPPKGTEEYRVYKRALEFKYANTEHGFLKRLFQSIYTRAKYNTNRNKQWQPEIGKKELEDIYNEQVKRDGKICLYCKTPFTFKRNERRKDLAKEKIKQIPTNVSADRYNPNETYKRGNIVFCCWECNRKKNTAYKQDWVNFLKGRKKIIK
jgi:5-methylcytosine-specific restriction endonuclease McrA|tara:strand:+ start:87 stop:548 length:462 start_codon:yes stop_codon:yes gene_type:complete